jgi:hypothetical protein
MFHYASAPSKAHKRQINGLAGHVANVFSSHCSSWVWPRVEEGAITLTRAQLAMLIEGLDWRRAVAFKDLPAPTAV